MVASRGTGLLVGWKLGLMMRDVACREGFSFQCDAGGFQARLWTSKTGKAHMDGTPKITAEGGVTISTMSNVCRQ